MSGIVGILLAAGAGHRFGGEKLMTPLADGTPLGLAAASVLLQALPHSIVVIRPDDRVLGQAFRKLGMKVTENPRADLGMGASLSTGVAASREADGWLIALADMPWIAPQTIDAVAGQLRRGASLTAPLYQGRRGHPVGLSSRWLPQLLAMTGDQGARALLHAYADELVPVHTDDAGVLADVDVPADLVRQGHG